MKSSGPEAEWEERTLPVAELRVSLDGDRPVIEGQAIVFGALSADLGGFRERFVAGSVDLEPDLLALFDHQTSMVIGRTSAGTLEASESPAGVGMRAWPPETTWASDLLASMRRGDIRHMSFRFRAIDDAYEYDRKTDTVVRTVKRALVSELSVVSMPAYPQTSAQARSRVEQVRSAVAAGGELADPAPGDDRAGKVLSSANYDKVGQARDLLDDVIRSAEGSAGRSLEPDPAGAEVPTAAAPAPGIEDLAGGSPAEDPSGVAGGSPVEEPTAAVSETYASGFGFVSVKEG